jgi:hypothetical protein
MGSGAVIYVPSFIKIGSGVQKLIGRDTQTYIHTHTHINTRTAMWSHKHTLFFQNKESMLKIWELNICPCVQNSWRQLRSWTARRHSASQFCFRPSQLFLCVLFPSFQSDKKQSGVFYLPSSNENVQLSNGWCFFSVSGGPYEPGYLSQCNDGLRAWPVEFDSGKGQRLFSSSQCPDRP